MGNKTERLAYQICSRTPCPYDKTGEPHEVSLGGVKVCFYTLEPKQPKAEEKCELCKVIHKGFDKDGFLKAAGELQNTIQKLPKRRGVKLSSTVAGQRELIREMRNKLDEVIEAVNKK